MRHLYEKRDRLGSRVSLTRVDYHDQTNTVKPTIDITAGEAVAIRATGAKISNRKLKELVPIFQERSIDADLLVEGERNIAQYLSHGVTLKRKQLIELKKEQRVTWSGSLRTRSVPARWHKFVYLAIEGNRYFQPKTIRERLYLQPARFPDFLTAATAMRIYGKIFGPLKTCTGQTASET